MEVFFFIGIIINSLLILLIFTKKQKAKSDIVFGIWQVILLLHFSLLFIRHSKLIEEFPHFLGLDSPLVLIHIPFIYFYTESVVSGSINKRNLILSFLPFGVMLFILSTQFFFLPGIEKLRIYESQIAGPKVYSIIDLILFLQYVLYLPLCYRLTKTYSKIIEEKFSNTDEINLKWLGVIIKGAAIMFGLVFLFQLFYLIFDNLSYTAISKISVVGICVFQMALGYYGIKRTSLFYDNGSDSKKQNSAKYVKTGLSKDQGEKLYQELCDYMAANKPFINSDLKLSDLAKQMDLSQNQLSQIINQFANQNFYAFVNGYRIEEVSEMLKDRSKNNISILGLAYDAGFKSKSVFNSLFKKQYGMTPSLYKKVNQ